ncbi:MAG: hypothetical protein ACO1TE_11895 [Prosthecobacter sp.]
MASLLTEQLKEQQMGIAAAVVQPLWQQASSFAAQVHAPEVHYHDMPFPEVADSFSQATRVALTLAGLYHCEDPHVLATALLHNVLEKTEVTFDDLTDVFGHLVALRVQRLTREPGLDEEVLLRRLYVCDWQTRVIKLADAADRLEDETEPLENRIEEAERVLPLAYGDDHCILRAQRHLTSLLENARVEASIMSGFTTPRSPGAAAEAAGKYPYLAA